MNTERLYAVLVNQFFFFDNKNKMNISRGSTFSLQPFCSRLHWSPKQAPSNKSVYGLFIPKQLLEKQNEGTCSYQNNLVRFYTKHPLSSVGKRDAPPADNK